MGGAEVALLNMLTAIRTAQPAWRLTLILGGPGPMAAKANALGVSAEVLTFPRSLARLGDTPVRMESANVIRRLHALAELLIAAPVAISYIRQLRRTIRRTNPDIIHTNGFKMHALGALAKPSRTALIWHVHDFVSTRPLMARVTKQLRRRCKLILANSECVKRDVESVCGDSGPVQTLYNAIDTNEFTPDGPQIDLDELSGLPPRASNGKPVIRVGLLATFARWKGHEVFLHALSLTPPDLPLRGYIIGAPLYETNGSQFSIAELKTLAQQLGVSDRVGFTGFVDQPAAAMRSLDIVVHSSTQPEPFGLVIVEGMACGRPVILSEAGGAAELLQKHNSNGKTKGQAELTALGHAPGDAKGLAQRIVQLASDANLRARLGLAGRATVEQRFKTDRLATELIPIYQAVKVAA